MSNPTDLEIFNLTVQETARLDPFLSAEILASALHSVEHYIKYLGSHLVVLQSPTGNRLIIGVTWNGLCNVETIVVNVNLASDTEVSIHTFFSFPKLLDWFKTTDYLK